MKIGIIGSTGFIGNNLYFYLSKFKNYKVFRYSSFKKNNKYWINKVSKEIKTTKPNIILNCAANQSLKNDKKSIKHLLNSNLYSNINFLDTLRDDECIDLEISSDGRIVCLGKTKGNLGDNILVSKKGRDPWREWPHVDFSHTPGRAQSPITSRVKTHHPDQYSQPQNSQFRFTHWLLEPIHQKFELSSQCRIRLSGEVMLSTHVIAFRAFSQNHHLRSFSGLRL